MSRTTAANPMPSASPRTFNTFTVMLHLSVLWLCGRRRPAAWSGWFFPSGPGLGFAVDQHAVLGLLDILPLPVLKAPANRGDHHHNFQRRPGKKQYDTGQHT